MQDPNYEVPNLRYALEFRSSMTNQWRVVAKVDNVRLDRQLIRVLTGLVPVGAKEVRIVDLWRVPRAIWSESNSRTVAAKLYNCLLYTSPSPRDRQKSRMPSSA